jgi:glycosyltransferase involved in cell wall biosynthesis
VLHARLALGPALRKAAVVVTPSRHAGERLVAAVGVERRRIAVVPHGVSPAFSPGPVPPDLLERLCVRRPYLLSVGVLQPRKNLAGALAALERLYAEGSDHMLVVAGGRGWGEEERLARLARSPLAGRVALVGEVSDPDLVGLYRGADCLLHLSRGEGFGLPALEAMACGTPVMAASVGSLPEVVGDAGVLVSLDDPDGVARTLRELLDSPRRRQELSASGLARARAFTWGRSGELAMAAYERAISAESTVRCA